MFGISFPELMVIAVIALLVFGPEKLPEVLRTIGSLSGQLRKTSESLRREFYNAVYEPAKEDLQKAKAELSSLRSDFALPQRYDPHCPDTIAKRSSMLQSASSSVAPALGAAPASPNGAPSAPSGSLPPPQNPNDTPPVVDIPLPPGFVKERARE